MIRQDQLLATDLTRANLKNADLTRADLRRAIMKDADFERAVMIGANVRLLDLVEAQTAGAHGLPRD
jgi:uncharacterized protein YjbI with pentapeptide repeats